MNRQGSVVEKSPRTISSSVLNVPFGDRKQSVASPETTQLYQAELNNKSKGKYGMPVQKVPYMKKSSHENCKHGNFLFSCLKMKFSCIKMTLSNFFRPEILDG